MTAKEWFEQTFQDKAERFDAFNALYKDHITDDMIKLTFEDLIKDEEEELE